MITKVQLRKNSKGWHFNVYYNDAETASFVSASYKTKREATEKLGMYVLTGNFDLYGSAE
jgi:hypothetical protein